MVKYSIIIEASFAAILSMHAGADAARGNDQPLALFGSGGIFTSISNVLLFIVGAIAVIMIVFAGFRYVTSGGNASTIAAAKNTILYAIIGLIIAMLAYAIIHFVIDSFASEEGVGVGGGTSALPDTGAVRSTSLPVTGGI